MITLTEAITDIATVEANVANGATMTVSFATAASATNTLKFIGSAETDGGKFNITGGIGVDTITGGDGDDTIIGGAGADIMNGGTDSFSWRCPQFRPTYLSACFREI